MKTIYFSGKSGDGKTAVALGAAVKLLEQGLKVSYFKPLGFQKVSSKKDDPDVLLMREALKLPFPSDVISPITVNPHYLSGRHLQEKENMAEIIDRAYSRCKEGCDVILIDGGVEPFVGRNRKLDDFNLAKRWTAGVIYVVKTDNDFELDRGLFYLELWLNCHVHVIGCIFNNISRAQWEKTRTIYVPLMERLGIPVLGIIPRRIEIAAPTVAEFYDALQGEILACPDRMNRLVEEVIVGTMTIESALSYLRRAPNKALITGGDRSDMALTALETSTSVIIFTGGLYPDVRVLSRAEEKGVPVILVHTDTYTTVENLHSAYRSIHPQNTEAIRIVKENVDKHINLLPLFDYLRS